MSAFVAAVRKAAFRLHNRVEAQENILVVWIIAWHFSVGFYPPGC